MITNRSYYRDCSFINVKLILQLLSYLGLSGSVWAGSRWYSCQEIEESLRKGIFSNIRTGLREQMGVCDGPGTSNSWDQLLSRDPEAALKAAVTRSSYRKGTTDR